VLDVGCGMGRYSLILAARGFRVEGLDISQVLLERLRDYAAGRFDIPLHCADMRHPPEELKGAFDAVAGFFVLHHLATLDGALVALTPLLKPGGRMVFLEPNPFNPMYHIQIMITPGMSREGEYSLNRMRRGPIFAAMREAGLVQPAMDRFGFLPPFVTNRPWGAKVERILEAVPVWRGLRPFQLFRGVRP
jgi:SAM-dependent methyltransferase